MKLKPDGDMLIACDGKPVPTQGTQMKLGDGRQVEILEVKTISSGSPDAKLTAGPRATHRLFFRFVS